MLETLEVRVLQQPKSLKVKGSKPMLRGQGVSRIELKVKRVNKAKLKAKVVNKVKLKTKAVNKSGLRVKMVNKPKHKAEAASKPGLKVRVVIKPELRAKEMAVSKSRLSVGARMSSKPGVVSRARVKLSSRVPSNTLQQESGEVKASPNQVGGAEAGAEGGAAHQDPGLAQGREVCQECKRSWTE